MLTIFTPSYNRANTLHKLYESLVKQTCKDFYWLIVDDGSNDGTDELVKKWQAENKISITYIWQENQGKSMAHNKGVELTGTELFTCVDSDDYLVENAVEIINETWKNANTSDIGILAFRRTPSSTLTRIMKNDVNRTTLKNAYDNLGLKGDTMLVFKSEIIKKYSFPKFENEKFVPEAYLYDLLDQEGLLILKCKSLYVCKYLEDGYTNNIEKLLYSNPNGYFAYINQRLKLESDIKHRYFDSARYVAMAVALRKKRIILDAVYPMYALFAYPLGTLIYLKKYRPIIKEDKEV